MTRNTRIRQTRSVFTLSPASIRVIRVIRGCSCLWLGLFLLLVTEAPAQHQPLPAEEAAAKLKLPPGFKATVFAAEPDVVQPIAFTFDDRGRLWVVECLSYPTWKSDGTGSDRVTILEDSDNDGQHDKRTVFFDKGCNLSGIEVGFGGVWLTAVPNLIFIPDADADDKPDGEPLVVLDGWDLAARHNVVGNLAWGPDGWLYGCNGILSNSRVGKPGTPDAERVAMNCGVWRYHPTRHAFEVVAHGTTNPWGLDWDERGQLFITNCVIKHLFHVVPEAHFVRMFGQDINPHSYGLIESCADHQHWAGGHWTSSRGAVGAHGDAGGGHAHSGCMVYLGDNWPAEYRGNVFTLNIHGQRMNRDTLERHGSTYVAKHAADLAFSQDPLFRGVACKYGPDGGVYISDWSDDGECHDQTEEDCLKTNGRIFKIVYEGNSADARRNGTTLAVGNALRGVPGPSLDLAKLTDAELASLQRHANAWHARHARRLLQERAAAGKFAAFDDAPLRELLASSGAKHEQLRALWTLHAIDRLDDKLLLHVMDAPEEELRAWAVVLAAESKQPSPAILDRFAKLAAEDESPFVRLHLASALQRMPLDQRWPIAVALVSRAADADDPYLPLMYWYAIEPLVPHDVNVAIDRLPQVRIPLVRQYLTRRILAFHEDDGKKHPDGIAALDRLIELLAETDNEGAQIDILMGLDRAFRGRQDVDVPQGWKAAYATLQKSPNKRVRGEAQWLSVVFGDREARIALQAIVISGHRSDRSIRALNLLHSLGDPAFGRTLLGIVQSFNSGLRPDAIRALSAYDLPEIPSRLIGTYPQLSAGERQDAIQTLTARPSFALALLDAIDQEKIPRGDVSALIIRQIQALGNEAVTQRLKEVWGDIRPSEAGKKERIATFKEQLTADALAGADLSRGRVLYTKHCATCHKLFGEGGSLAPELTGAQRHSLDYVLDNVLDPSAIVPREYKVSVLRLADGRVVQGVIAEETSHAVAVQTANELVRIPAGEIEARQESPHSMMPEGLFDRLAADEVRDLVAYLASPQQVPLPK